MSEPFANPVRGEAVVSLGERSCVLRPSFAALVAAESEIGPLFALVERAAAGQLSLGETTALFWHTRAAPDAWSDRAVFSENLAAAGLAALTPALRVLLQQILQGR